jgi:hypothetical protein
VRTPIILVAITLAALAFFNPTLEDFQRFAAVRAEQMLLEQTGDNPLGQFLAGHGGSVAARMIASRTERTNYLIFSTYEVRLADGLPESERWRFLGIAGQFIETRAPDSFRNNSR